MSLALLNIIRPGNRVTVVSPHGGRITGRAVMRGPAGWVLNCGGAHGTPRVATVDNIVSVTVGKARARAAAGLPGVNTVGEVAA